MNRKAKQMVWVVLLALIPSASLRAQESRGKPAPRPKLSPYLNQLRGVNPAVNYYFALSDRNANPAVRLEAPTPAARPEAATSGHRVRFMNCEPYFQLESGVRTAERNSRLGTTR